MTTLKTGTIKKGLSRKAARKFLCLAERDFLRFKP
jgi:hypothetical protein